MYALTLVGVNVSPRDGVTVHWTAFVEPDGRSFRKVTFSPEASVACPVPVPVTSMSPMLTAVVAKPPSGVTVVALS